MCEMQIEFTSIIIIIIVKKKQYEKAVQAREALKMRREVNERSTLAQLCYC